MEELLANAARHTPPGTPVWVVPNARAPACSWRSRIRLAELHGGTAWVEDRPGGGAALQVTLPGPPAR